MTKPRPPGYSHEPSHAAQPHPPAPPPDQPRTGNDFGQEGTNKTVPVPKPDGAESEELGSAVPHAEKSPHTRG